MSCADYSFCNFLFSNWGVVFYQFIVTLIGISWIFDQMIKAPIYKPWLWNPTKSNVNLTNHKCQ